jgi:hypothetical protein
MEDDVDDGILCGLGRLAFDCRGERFPAAWKGHVADGRDPAGCRRSGTGGEVVAPARAGQHVLRRRQVNVRVDPAGKDQQSAGVDFPCPRHLAPDLGDGLAADPYVGGEGRIGGDNRTVADDQIERRGHVPSHPSQKTRREGSYPSRRICALSLDRYTTASDRLPNA